MKVLCSCDSRFFLAFYRSWFYSALKAGYTPILNVINPNPDVIRIVDTLRKERPECFNYGTIDYTFAEEVGDLAKQRLSRDMIFYCCNRFYIAEKYLSSDGLLIADADGVFLRKLPPIEEDVGLFFRDKAGLNEYRTPKQQKKLSVWDEKGKLISGAPSLLINCSLIWLNGNLNSKLFLRRFVERIELQSKYIWLADQKALCKTFMELQEDISTFYFTKQHLNWENDETSDSYICSGHADSRFKDVYRKHKSRMDKESESIFGPLMDEKENVIIETIAVMADKDGPGKGKDMRDMSKLDHAKARDYHQYRVKSKGDYHSKMKDHHQDFFTRIDAVL